MVGEHSEECSIKKDIELQTTGSRSPNNIYGGSDEYIKGAFRLNLQSPSTRRLDSTGENASECDDEDRGKLELPEASKRKI